MVTVIIPGERVTIKIFYLQANSQKYLQTIEHNLPLLTKILNPLSDVNYE